MATLKVKIIKIGNSRGIRLPKAIIDQYQLNDEAALETGKDGIVIRPLNNPRAGWEAAFKEMKRVGDDRLLDAESGVSSDWDEKEWEW
jgi:antitoxin MazE